MLKLLVSVSLDALEQCREGLLLFLTEEGLVLLDSIFQSLLCNLRLILLHLLSLQLEQLSLFIPLRECKFLGLVF